MRETAEERSRHEALLAAEAAARRGEMTISPEVRPLKRLFAQVERDPTSVDAWQAIINYAIGQLELI